MSCGKGGRTDGSGFKAKAPRFLIETTDCLRRNRALFIKYWSDGLRPNNIIRSENGDSAMIFNFPNRLGDLNQFQLQPSAGRPNGTMLPRNYSLNLNSLCRPHPSRLSSVILPQIAEYRIAEFRSAIFKLEDCRFD